MGYVWCMYQMICRVLEVFQARDLDASDGTGTGIEADKVRGGYGRRRRGVVNQLDATEKLVY